MKSIMKMMKLASKFQIKLAEIDEQAVLAAFNKFFSETTQSWFLGNNMSGASEKHAASHSAGETHYDWFVTVTIPDKTKKNLVESGSGTLPSFVNFLKQEYLKQSKDQKSGLYGTTATFEVIVQ